MAVLIIALLTGEVGDESIMATLNETNAINGEYSQVEDGEE